VSRGFKEPKMSTTFGYSKRPDLNKNNKNPGPGDYNITKVLVKSKEDGQELEFEMSNSAPKFSFAGKRDK
jgi:hypothetical protein